MTDHQPARPVPIDEARAREVLEQARCEAKDFRWASRISTQTALNAMLALATEAAQPAAGEGMVLVPAKVIAGLPHLPVGTSGGDQYDFGWINALDAARNHLGRHAVHPATPSTPPSTDAACPECGDTSPLPECATCGCYPLRQPSTDAAGEVGKVLTADEMERHPKGAPWHTRQPIEDFAKYWKGRQWVPLDAAISALQFWQRRDYEHSIAALSTPSPVASGAGGKIDEAALVKKALSYTAFGSQGVVQHQIATNAVRVTLEAVRATPPAPSDDLRAAAEAAIDWLKSAPLESGYCCCGSPVDTHGMGDGHSPVDELACSARQLQEHLSAALSGERKA